MESDLATLKYLNSPLNPVYDSDDATVIAPFHGSTNITIPLDNCRVPTIVNLNE